MLWTILGLLGGAGMACLLYLMWYSPKGVPALKKCDPHFSLLDMRFHYSSPELYRQLEALGSDGIVLQRRFWKMDFFFIACFWLVMISISRGQALGTIFYIPLIALASVRAALDALENLLLLSLCAAYPRQRRRRAAFSGFVTSCKFLALYAWVALLFIRLFIRAFGIS